MKYTYTLENLNCAHCAGKIETKIAATDGYEKVSFNFATKALNFYSEKDDTLTEIQQICDSIEDGVTVVDNAAPKNDGKEEKDSKLEKILLVIAVVLGVSAAVLHLALDNEITHWAVLGLSLAATALSGYEVFIKGVKNALKLRIDETVLMTIAVIAAFILGEFVEAAMVTILFSIGELIEDKAVSASRKDIEKLSQIRPDTATILHHGHEETVATESVEIGTEIIVKPYERIPLDGTVTFGSSQIDASALTGESIPASVSIGSQVMSGAVNGSGLIRLVTTKKFGESTAARILKMVEDAAAQKGNSEKFISRFAAVYTPIVVGLAVLIAVLPPLCGLGAFSQWIYNALVVLVASCPCAIVISVPLAYYSGIGAASGQGVLIKGGKYLEALAAADAFAFDKTGTLTTGELKVEKLYALKGYSESEILNLAAACEKYSSHPIASAIKKAAGGIEGIKLTGCSELAGRGVRAEYNGKILACGNERIVECPIPENMKNATVFLVYDSRLIGAIEVSDSVRAEAKSVIEKLKALGVKTTLMLTGDAKANAEKAANALNLSDYKAELLPEDKLNAVKELKKNSKAVCFVGDGINDAPVLSASDCGVAMGLGSEAAIEAGDAVLSAGNLSQLPSAVKIARKTMRTIRANIIFALVVKAAVIILACLGLASIWMSVIADTGVCVLCVLYTARLLRNKG